MPKQTKGSKGKQKKVAAQSDNDFDDMLAESCAADLTTTPASSTTTTTTTTTKTATTASPSSTTPSSVPSMRTTARAPPAEEALSRKVIEAIKAGDIIKLTRWARRGDRLPNAAALVGAAWMGKLDVVKVLVQEFGADVNQATDDGHFPLIVEANKGHIHIIRYLVLQEGADVNQSTLFGDYSNDIY
jgi:hypothetical protein